MAFVWKVASTRSLIFLADAQSADPEELQVLDTFLRTSRQGFQSHYRS